MQITTKYRYQMLRKEVLKVECKVVIEEACKRHGIAIKILKILKDHVHLIVDCLRIIYMAKLMQVIKGLSSFIMFRLCPALRKRYHKGHFRSEGYYCASCGSDFDRAMKYIETQEEHHGLAPY
jgi:putative transposase